MNFDPSEVINVDEVNDKGLMYLIYHETKDSLDGEVNKIVMAIKLPSGAIEIIVNDTDLDNKFNYYMNAYDDDLKLKSNPAVEILDFMFV